MRKIISLVAALSLVAISLGDGWLIKPPYKEKDKVTNKLTVNASMGGQDHEANMKMVFTVTTKTDKETKGQGTLTDIMLDGQDMSGQDIPTWDVTLNADGSVASAGDSADYARMLAPFTFVYPSKEVKAGDKWTVKFKPAKDAKEMTVDYEVVEQTKLGDDDVLKIKTKLSEDGPMKADDTYWVAKDGRVLKFELDIKNWVAPFAGNGADLDAKIKGELVKNK